LVSWNYTLHSFSKKRAIFRIKYSKINESYLKQKP
jgi:hypothetical protein